MTLGLGCSQYPQYIELELVNVGLSLSNFAFWPLPLERSRMLQTLCGKK